MSSEKIVDADILLELGLLLDSHGLERNSDGPFAWCPRRFRLSTPPGAKFLRLAFAYLAPEGSITVEQDGNLVERIALRHGWQLALLRLPAGASSLNMTVDPVPSVEGDPRELGVMLRSATFFDHEAQYARTKTVLANVLLNDEEFRNGTATLTSRPPNLRISTETRCNIPETSQACTYCAWDKIKAEEKDPPPFRLETVDQLGDFYRDAIALNDCSTGEPVMNRQFGDIVLRFHSDGKPFSFTTNGQWRIGMSKAVETSMTFCETFLIPISIRKSGPNSLQDDCRYIAVNRLVVPC
jgi:hypothetical protein